MLPQTGASQSLTVLSNRGYVLRVICPLQFAEAEDDCSKALQLDDKNVKALFRRVLARKVS